MVSFPADAYGPVVTAILADAPPMPLDMGRPNEKMREQLTALAPAKLFVHTGKSVCDLRMAQCCVAGLWLRHNFFEESHAISQEIATPTGSFWHAILHRREPDYSNAHYWFRRVGTHPIWAELNNSAMALGWPQTERWDAFGFIEAVESALRSKDGETIQLCERFQWLEWELLFDYCWRHSLS